MHLSISANRDSTQAELPIHSFDENVQLDDEKPFPNWVPSPRQIREFGRMIREERREAEFDDVSTEPIGRK